jgi:hypothetical protein
MVALVALVSLANELKAFNMIHCSAFEASNDAEEGNMDSNQGRGSGAADGTDRSATDATNKVTCNRTTPNM